MTDHVDQQSSESSGSSSPSAPPTARGVQDGSQPERVLRAPVALRWLTMGAFVLAACAVLLAWGRHGGAGPYPAGQRLLVLAGLGLLPGGLWVLNLDADRTARWKTSPRAQGLGILSVALAFIGGGMSFDQPGSPWLLLLAPGAICAFAFARWLIFDPAAAAVDRRWLAVAGALLFGMSGLVAAVSGVA